MISKLVHLVLLLYSDTSSETLAWASVQIYCNCSLDETKAHFVRDEAETGQTTMASPETSFNPSKGERGHIVFSTTPRILFCDLNLQPDESKTFVYQENIPHNAPPSYYGQAVKYLYKLTIGTQRVNAVIQLLRMPLRILSISCPNNLESLSLNDAPTLANGQTNGSWEDNSLDVALHKLECLTARRSPNSFLITNQLGKVVRFCLLKSTFKLGEDVVGVFNFSEANVPCVQVNSDWTCFMDCRANEFSILVFRLTSKRRSDFRAK